MYQIAVPRAPRDYEVRARLSVWVPVVQHQEDGRHDAARQGREGEPARLCGSEQELGQGRASTEEKCGDCREAGDRFNLIANPRSDGPPRAVSQLEADTTADPPRQATGRERRVGETPFRSLPRADRQETP